MLESVKLLKPLIATVEVSMKSRSDLHPIHPNIGSSIYEESSLIGLPSLSRPLKTNQKKPARSMHFRDLL